MLRRKLLLILGSLVALLMLAAFSAIVVLNGLLDDLSGLSTQALERSAASTMLGSSLTSIEAELTALRLEEERHLDDLIVAAEQLSAQVDDLDALPRDGADHLADLERLRALLPTLTRHVGDLATARDEASLRMHTDLAMKAASGMRDAVAAISSALQAKTDAQHERVTTRFRWTVLGLGLTFMLLINGAIIVLLRAAALVIKPVDTLVEASHRLAREEFDQPVEMERNDEFGELASAYNMLAAQLRQNEQRKLETLQQVARALNHELNNAIAIIEMQLELVARTTGPDGTQAERLRQIHDTLQRMSRTVEALNRVRRIVLTDYVEGVKMLDLERSVEEAPTAPQPVTETIAQAQRR